MKSSPQQLAYWREYRRNHREEYRQYCARVKTRRAEQLKAWSAKNRDKRNASSKRFREAHPDRISAQNKKYYLRNLSRLKAKQREYSNTHTEQIRSNLKRYHKARYSVPEIRLRLIKQTGEYAKTHPAIRRKCFLNWITKNPDRYKALCRKHRMTRRARLKSSTINPKSISVFVDGTRAKATVKCYYCDKSTPGKTAHFDHIIPLSKGGAHSVENLCVSCPHCNWSKNDTLIEDWFRLGQQILSL